MNIWKPLLILGLILAAGGPSVSLAQDYRGVSVTLNSIRIRDEDDPTNNDEPYLIFVRVRARIIGPADARRLDGRSIAVSLAMNGQNNLGLTRDNWADEPTTYSIPTTIPRIVQDIFPANEDGWLVAGLVLHMEEDSFSSRTARELGENLRSVLDREIRRFTEVGGRLNTDDLIQELINGVLISVVRDVSRSSAVRAVASGVDPDDFGGVQVALGYHLGRGLIATYSGDPTALVGFLSGGPLPRGVQLISDVTTSRAFSMEFPGGLTGDLPFNARFNGKHIVNGVIRTWSQRF